MAVVRAYVYYCNLSVQLCFHFFYFFSSFFYLLSFFQIAVFKLVFLCSVISEKIASCSWYLATITEFFNLVAVLMPSRYAGTKPS
jgi:hypothetical protein